jgi:hypothetical protein
MSWYHKDYHYREAITVDVTGSGTTIDVEVTVPPDLSRFWDTVESDNDDVIVCASDGQTKLDFEVSTWNYANRSAVIKIKAYALPNGQSSISGKIVCLWLYWGFDDGANGSPTSAQNTNLAALSNEYTGQIEVVDPSRAAADIIQCAFEPPETTQPRQVVHMPGGTEIKTHVFYDARSMLAARRDAFNGTLVYEEIDTVDFTIKHSDGTDLTSSMTVEAENRIFHPGLVRCTIKTVSAHVNDNYLLTLKLITDLGRIYEFYTTLKVRKISAPTAS